VYHKKALELLCKRDVQGLFLYQYGETSTVKNLGI